MSTAEELLARRARHISPAQSVLYREDPIHAVSARGQYIYDAAGVEYLDCMNNVPHVGHSHPRVNQAISDQLGRVNTNTRFLYEPLVAYAERLSALVPGELSVCFFVNSGSEANELALRIARAHTGRRGVVALRGAYHGNTGALIDVSPYKFEGPGGAGRPAHVQVVPTPDPYAGVHRDEGAAPAYVAEVEAAFARAEKAVPAGALIAEALMGTAGQVEPPPGFLPGAYAAARAHGAVVIADEVQIGFGRLGTHFWGFEAQGAQPDIVTLGKPIGNGFPLGAVVTTPEIAASFDNGMEFFCTFGGSPVACAAGLAVLDVLEEEGLREHALAVGEHLTAGYRSLAASYESIGNVRGSGLFLGVDLVTSRETRAPDGALAAALVAHLRANGVLCSTDGPGHNVFKLKPPLPFTAADADRLLSLTDGFLRARA